MLMDKWWGHLTAGGFLMLSDNPARAEDLTGLLSPVRTMGPFEAETIEAATKIATDYFIANPSSDELYELIETYLKECGVCHTSGPKEYTLICLTDPDEESDVDA